MERRELAKRWLGNLLTDLIGGLLLSVGVYNFAVASHFPVSGFSGLTVILNHFTGLSLGTLTVLLNIPIIAVSCRVLERKFFYQSFQTMLLLSLVLDHVAPRLPVFQGDRLLSAICMGICCGVGLGLIYLRGSSIAGADFIVMAIRKKKPHLSIGNLLSVFDSTVIVSGGLLLHYGFEGILYGLISDFILTRTIDRIVAGSRTEKLTLIVTTQAEAMAAAIDRVIHRGATFLKAEGSYTHQEKKVVLCACDTRQLTQLHQAISETDSEAFTITVDASEIRGRGFLPR